MDPDRAFNMLFTKSTASLTGPDDDIVTSPHVKLLDYEIELAIVIGRAIAGPGRRREMDRAPAGCYGSRSAPARPCGKRRAGSSALLAPWPCSVDPTDL